MGRERARKKNRARTKVEHPPFEEMPSTTALAAETIRHEESRRAFRDLDDRALIARFADTCKSATAGLSNGPYSPTRVIGRGGQSVVLELAPQSATAEKLAIRLVDPGSAIAGTTLPQAKSAEGESGPLETRAGGIQYVNGQAIAYQVLPLLAGGFVSDAKSKRLGRPTRLQRFASLVSIVARMHQQGVCHYDIKPDNILAAHDGSPVLIDFGNALPATASATPTGASAGHAAPEQVGASSVPIGASTDVFALGMVLWEYLNEEPVCPPDQSKSLASYCAYLKEDHAARLAQLVNADPQLGPLVRDCCALAPADRKIPDAPELKRRVQELTGAKTADKTHTRNGKNKPTQEDLAQQARLRLTRTETGEADTLGRALGVTGHRIQLAEIHLRLAIRDISTGDGKEATRYLSREGQGRDFIDATKSHDFLLIKGVAGSGKTTVLRYLANALARKRLSEELEGDQRTCIPSGVCPEPLFIRLRDVVVPPTYIAKPELATDANAFNTILTTWLHSKGLTYPIDTLVKDVAAGNCILLLDGLDEVRDEGERAALAKAIGAFARKVNTHASHGGSPTRARVIVSSRPAAIENIEFPAPLFQTAEVLPLKDDQVGEFARKWTRLAMSIRTEEDLAPGSLASERCRSIAAALNPQRSPELFELAHNPMLLTLIVLVHHETGSLPAQRVALYDQAVDVLLRNFRADWDARHSDWSPRRAREVLADVAWKCFTEKPAAKGDYALAQTTNWVADHLRDQYLESDSTGLATRARAFLEEHNRKGFVLETPREPVEKFLHRSIREFLAGWWLANQSDAVRLQLFRKGANDPSKDLHEALKMMAGVIASRGAAPAMRFVLDILGRSDPKNVKPFAQRASDIAAAIRLVGDMRSFDLPPAVFQPIEQDAAALIAAIEDPKVNAKDRISFAEALGVFGDPRLQPLQRGTKAEREAWENRFGRWIEIPAGTFKYGMHDALVDTPIEAYALARWPVTIDEYARFIEAGGYDDDNESFWRATRGEKDAKERRPAKWVKNFREKAGNHPVVGVSWHEAKAYCAWLTETEGGGRYVFDLPTDAQWEAAVRGTLRLPDGRGGQRDNPLPIRDYPWEEARAKGAEPNWEKGRANVSGAGVGNTSPVGSFPGDRGPFGHWDLAGNVWEWCTDASTGRDLADNRRYYRAELSANGSRRVIRGGGFRDGADSIFGHARCSSRYGLHPSGRSGDLGFRPARVSADLLHHLTSGNANRTR